MELFDLPEPRSSIADSDAPTEVATALVGVVAEVFGTVVNGIAVQGHAPRFRWSSRRTRCGSGRRSGPQAAADAVAGRDRRGPHARVTGFADRKPVVSNPMSVRNNRVELILLRIASEERSGHFRH